MVKVCIKTAGCSHNLADSEAMAQFLQEAGFQVTFENEKEADVVVYNTCTVKTPTDDKFFTKLSRQKKPVVLAGCIPQSQKNEKWLKNYSAVGVDELDKIVSAVRACLQHRTPHFLDVATSPPQRDFLPTTRVNSFIAIIPLLQGCLGHCTFCKTKQARGNLKSYPQEIIIHQIRLAKQAGVKEVWLVSEDNGAYGLDRGSSLPELLEQLVSFQGIKIRIGMLNPQFAFRYRKELARLLSFPVFYRFLHIPVQSGSDSVLRDMKRPYTIAQCKETFSFLKEHLPDITLATDIICGYPTESLNDFSATMNLLEDEQFDVLNISKFYARPQTFAATLTPLPTKEVKRRSKEVTKWFVKQNNNKDFEKKIVSVLFTSRGKNNTLLGRTDNYRQVVVGVPKGMQEKEILGTRRMVKIYSTTRDDLRGEIVR